MTKIAKIELWSLVWCIVLFAFLVLWGVKWQIALTLAAFETMLYQIKEILAYVHADKLNSK